MTFQAIPLFDQRLLTRTNHYGHFLHILKAKCNTRNHLELLLKIQKASSVVFPYGRKHKKSNGAKSGLYRGRNTYCANSPRSIVIWE
jgi:hypothetical protein